MSEPGFRTMIRRILAGVEKKQRILFCRDKRSKSSPNEIKNVMTEMQYQMDTTTVRMDEAQQQSSDLEDKIMENNEAEKKRETKAKDHNTRLSDLL